MPVLLIVDDEPNVLYSLRNSLNSADLEIVTATTAKQGIDLFRERLPDAVLLDVRLPDMSGLDAFREMQSIDRRTPVVVITAHATTETAIEAMKRGAFDCLLKPVDLRQLRDVVRRALETSRLARVPAVLDRDGSAESGVTETAETADDRSADRIIGRSSAMQEVYKAIGRAAASDFNVLLLGESGTGKELVARAVYQHSRRSAMPFLAINCAAIPEALLESELFGHERGSFTSADRRRIGKFEQATGGTVFLDEIGDMSGATQAKMLRLLQDQRFERVGGSETIQTDVRIIAATNQDLEAAVAAGRFRADLYYRLKVYSIWLPPLRERLDDLPLLVEHFIAQFGHGIERPVHGVRPETLDALIRHSWPGNVRELQATIKYALVNATSDVLTPDSLPPEFRSGGSAARPWQVGATGDEIHVARLARQLLAAGETEIYRHVIAAVERVLWREVLEAVGGNQVEASRRLGISRTTLRTKLDAMQGGDENANRAETPED